MCYCFNFLINTCVLLQESWCPLNSCSTHNQSGTEKRKRFKCRNSYYIGHREWLSSFWTVNFARWMFSATSSDHHHTIRDSSKNNEVQRSISWQSSREKATETIMLKEFQDESLKNHQDHKWVTLASLKPTSAEAPFFQLFRANCNGAPNAEWNP